MTTWEHAYAKWRKTLVVTPRAIPLSLAASGIKGRDIAARYAVTPANISCILTGKTWRFA